MIQVQSPTPCDLHDDPSRYKWGPFSHTTEDSCLSSESKDRCEVITVKKIS